MDIEERRARHKIARQKSREIAKEFVTAYLLEHPCVDCGETDPMVLTFDHVRGEKRGHISDMVGSGFGLETIKAEIIKTDVTCYNCHSLREQARRGAYRFRAGKTGKLL